MTPSPASRFGGFASGHFVVTTLCACLLFFQAPGILSLPDPLPAILMMFLYVPAGWTVSSLRRWARPTPRDGIKAILYPALLAWGWALGGWLLFVSGVTWPLAGSVGSLMLLSTYFLASPSFLLMLTGLQSDLAFTTLTFSLQWYGLIFLAGLLPPLLFCLGSLLPHPVRRIRHEKKTDLAPSDSADPLPDGPVCMEPVQPDRDKPVCDPPSEGSGTDRGGLPDTERGT